MEIGCRIYYDKATGEAVLNTGERSGWVIETSVEHDFSTYKALSERLPNTIGMLQLEYGQHREDFMICKGYRIEINGEAPQLVFLYPDNSAPELQPVYHIPLSDKVEQLEADNAMLAHELAQMQVGLIETKSGLSQTKSIADQQEQAQADLLFTLVEKGVL